MWGKNMHLCETKTSKIHSPGASASRSRLPRMGPKLDQFQLTQQMFSVYRPMILRLSHTQPIWNINTRTPHRYLEELKASLLVRLLNSIIISLIFSAYHVKLFWTLKLKSPITTGSQVWSKFTTIDGAILLAFTASETLILWRKAPFTSKSASNFLAVWVPIRFT